jgi:hypothetical protein
MIAAKRPNLYKVSQVKRKYFLRPRLRVTAVPNIPLRVTCQGVAAVLWTPDLVSVAGPVPALRRTEAGRLHPTSIGTPAARRSGEDGGCASASRSEAGPDTRAFPAPRPLKGVWLVPPKRASRLAGLAVGAGRARAVSREHNTYAPWFLSKVRVVRGARPAAHPSDWLPGLLSATHESGVLGSQ